MKLENEITVLVKCSYEELKKILESNDFLQKQEYVVNDIYMINNQVDLKNTKKLDILSKCILVRDVVGFEKTLTYKYKKYSDNNDIIEQGKVKCPVLDIKKAVEFMKMIDYKKLFEIHDTCIVFVNKETELVVQLVNDKYIFIEMEDKCEFVDKVYKDVNEMKNDLLSYNLPIDTSNFFVKKALIMLNEIIKGGK